MILLFIKIHNHIIISEFCLLERINSLSRMWSNWFEEAKKKAEEALKATSQVVSEVLYRCLSGIIFRV